MTVEIKLTPEQAACANEVAESEGVSTADILADRAMAVLRAEQRELVIIRERIAQADRGEFLTSEQMNQRVARMLSPR